MTNAQEQDPEKVARLQEQLADAEAQIAAVKAQLGDAAGEPAGQAEQTQQAREQWTDELREALSPLDFDQLASGLGNAATYAPPEVAPLAPPPRKVPFTFRIAVFTWSWYEGFCVFMGIVAPIALWGFFPALIPSGFISGIALIAYIRGGKAVRRLGLVKHGVVATVTKAEQLSRGTYYSGVTYSNMWITQAHGWDVTRRFYSGPSTKTRIDYTVEGTAGSFVLRGMEYEGGVVLAHPRRPWVALCVNQFVYAVKPDASGQMKGGLRIATWIGIPFTLLLELGLVAGAVYSVSYFWL